MLKKYLCAVSVSILIASPVLANKSDYYLNLPVMGHSISKTPEVLGNYVGSMSNANIIGFGVGYNLPEDYRVELNLNYRNNYGYKSELFSADYIVQQDSQNDITAITPMINMHKDFLKYEGFTTYLSSGIGFSKISLGTYTSFSQISDLDPTIKTAPGGASYNISWQLGGGTSIDVGDTSKLDFNYRFTNVGNFASTIHPVSNEKIKGNLSGHEFMVGLRTYF